MTSGSDSPPEERAPRQVSRREAARILGCSGTQVCRYEQAGRLAATRVPVPYTTGVRVRLDLEEVRRLRRELDRAALPRRESTRRHVKADGEIAARVFEELRRERSLADIVIDHKVHPDVVVALRDEYARSFEQRDRERSDAERRRREKQEWREQQKVAARQEKADRAAAEQRRRRRRERLGAEDEQREIGHERSEDRQSRELLSRAGGAAGGDARRRGDRGE